MKIINEISHPQRFIVIVIKAQNAVAVAMRYRVNAAIQLNCNEGELRGADEGAGVLIIKSVKIFLPRVLNKVSFFFFVFIAGSGYGTISPIIHASSGIMRL